MIDCTPPHEAVVIEAPAPSSGMTGLVPAIHPFHWLLERFRAITGIGLADASAPGPPPRRHLLPAAVGTPRLGYLAAGHPAGRKVVFVHGSPGHAGEWLGFLDRAPADQYRIAVDRPGFGESVPREPMPTLGDQARAIATLLGTQELAIVVGSSFGGPVALRLAADYPGRVAGVLLVGAAADPERERTHPLQRLAALDPLAGLLPTPLANSNAELMTLKDELVALGAILGQITAPVTILQGLRDTLVPPENATYLVERLASAGSRRLILVEGAGHFLPFRHAPLVEQALDCVLADAAHMMQRERNRR